MKNSKKKKQWQPSASIDSKDVLLLLLLMLLNAIKEETPAGKLDLQMNILNESVTRKIKDSK